VLLSRESHPSKCFLFAFSYLVTDGFFELKHYYCATVAQAYAPSQSPTGVIVRKENKPITKKKKK
jgi:hypothetical protein